MSQPPHVWTVRCPLLRRDLRHDPHRRAGKRAAQRLLPNVDRVSTHTPCPRAALIGSRFPIEAPSHHARSAVQFNWILSRQKPVTRQHKRLSTLQEQTGIEIVAICLRSLQFNLSEPMPRRLKCRNRRMFQLSGVTDHRFVRLFCDYCAGLPIVPSFIASLGDQFFQRLDLFAERLENSPSVARACNTDFSFLHDAHSRPSSCNSSKLCHGGSFNHAVSVRHLSPYHGAAVFIPILPNEAAG